MTLIKSVMYVLKMKSFEFISWSRLFCRCLYSKEKETSVCLETLNHKVIGGSFTSKFVRNERVDGPIPDNIYGGVT